MRQPPQAAALKPDREMADGTSLASAAAAGAPSAGMIQPPSTASAIRDLMWRDAGLFRSQEGLAGAIASLDQVPASALEDPALRTLTTVARLIARAALRREESRGGHFRSDFPQRDDHAWQRHLVDVRAEA
jgi:L-aspartate oxidase